MFPTIKVKNTQTQETNLGWLVGDSLVVVKDLNWEIWNKHGATIFRNISSDTDALELAKWLDSIYHPYFLIWQAYPEIDIFQLSMWTVKDGLRLFETIEHLRLLPRIDLSTIKSIFEQATGRKYYWNYMKESRA